MLQLAGLLQSLSTGLSLSSVSSGTVVIIVMINLLHIPAHVLGVCGPSPVLPGTVVCVAKQCDGCEQANCRAQFTISCCCCHVALESYMS